MDSPAIPDQPILMLAPHPLDIDFGWYPDGMPVVTGKAFLLPQYELLLRPRGLEDFFAAMFMVDALAERGAKASHLVLPFLPGARQDRLNLTGDWLFTAKSIAREINLRGVAAVTCFDPHSDVMPALIDRCNVIEAKSVFPWPAPPLVVYEGVIAPDGGAVKRAHAIASKLGVPTFHAWKPRDVSDGSITGFGCQDLPDGAYLVVDDICDGGGTFAGLAEAIRTKNPHTTLDLWVSHGIFSKGVEPLAAYRHIVTTDSVLRDPLTLRPSDLTRIRTIPICADLIEVSRKIQYT